VTGRRGGEELARLIERSSELKRDLVDFACSPRLRRFRKILRQRDFTWAEHGEALMRRRKAWYYQREPRPGVSVIGARLMELASGDRR
jgi:hypothetical protein